MISGAAPCNLSYELLTVDFQHQILLTALIEEKYAVSCCQILMSYDCYPVSKLLQLVLNVTVDGYDVD